MEAEVLLLQAMEGCAKLEPEHPLTLVSVKLGTARCFDGGGRWSQGNKGNIWKHLRLLDLFG